ncbi:MAG: sigma-E factor negative regulatory protein [Gammaproteobacteria bacterium]|nr:sigma-E factor negative regulatory protein [Gammaproteobacteria bacterium]
MSTGPADVPLVEEQLSAWLDDELPAAELALLAARLARSPEQRARAARYGLIGSTLRDGPAGPRSAGLAALQISARVSAALDDDIAAPAPAAAPRPATRLLPYAAAAGVALVAVALMPLLRPAPGSAGIPNARVAVQSPIQPAALTPVRAQSLVVQRTGIAGQPYLSPRRLTSYLVYHGEYSGMLSAKLTDSHIVNKRAYGAAMHAADQPAVR